jgi:hypothetical protein
MDVSSLLVEARRKVSYRLPRSVNIDQLIERVRQEVVNMAMEKLQDAMEQAILGAQSILKSTCQEYVDALYITDDMKIAIREDKAYLETGYDGYEMREALLNGPKAKVSKDGDRYVVVPIGKKSESNVTEAIGRKTSELFSKGKSSNASDGTLGRMVQDMQSLARRSFNNDRPASEGETRTVSDKQDGGWVHPGFQGVNQLEFINETLRSRLLEETVRIIESAASRMR